jgi:hypothetical protein
MPRIRVATEWDVYDLWDLWVILLVPSVLKVPSACSVQRVRRAPNAKRRTLNPLKPHLRSIDLSSTLDKELFQISCIKAPILFRIHP